MSRRKKSKKQPAAESPPQGETLRTNKQNLLALVNWFLPNQEIFAKLKFHGNTSWRPTSLVWLAICWSWSTSPTLTDAFAEALEYSQMLTTGTLLSTYQGFMAAMVTWSDTFINLLFWRLQVCMAEIGGRFWEIDGWVPIAFDGSRSTAPRTKKNEKAFCAPNYGKGTTARFRKKKTQGLRRQKNQKSKPAPPEPQAWITLLWHMGLRLPWRWMLGPSNSSERTHVLRMLHAGGFPPNTLFCGDAGFVGYPLWSQILGTGAHFLVRVGANVSLLAESTNFTRLSRQKDGLVLCWPKTMSAANQPPLSLRLVKGRIGKKTTVWMLTSVLNSEDLTAKQMLKFYEMRWGIELEFRGLKQTLDRAKLRSRNDQRLLAELNWSMMALAIAELFALKNQLAPAPRPQKPNQNPPQVDIPAKRSLANTLRALRWCLSHLHQTPTAKRNLLAQLRLAVTDDYQRKSRKRARYRPKNPDKKKLGGPKLRKLTADEKIKLGQLIEKRAA